MMLKISHTKANHPSTTDGNQLMLSASNISKNHTAPSTVSTTVNKPDIAHRVQITLAQKRLTPRKYKKPKIQKNT